MTRTHVAFLLAFAITALVACTADTEVTASTPVTADTPDPTATLAPAPTALATPTFAALPVQTPSATPEPPVRTPVATPKLLVLTATPDPILQRAPVEVLAEAIARTFATGGYHFLLEMVLTTQLGGAALAIGVVAEGDFSSPDRSGVIVDIRGPDIALRTRQIVIGQRRYQTDPQTGEWRDGALPATPIGRADELIRLDPQGLAEVQIVGIDTLDGILVYHLKATAPPGMVGGSPGPVELEYWVGVGDRVIRQMTAQGEITWEQIDLFLGLGTGRIAAMDATIKLSGFGRTAAISAPDIAATASAGTRAGTALTTTTPMHVARRVHTATLLDSGAVLVAGGVGSDGVLSPTEIYDPMADRWTTAENMDVAREFHTATLLDDGSVLVVGGSDGTSLHASAERFDPATRTWSPAGEASRTRGSATATLLGDGTVLVIGGGGDDAATQGVDLYDPVTGVWTEPGALGVARAAHSAILIGGGRVLVAGGIDAEGGAIDSVELYDPVTRTWTPGAPMLARRALHTLAALADGRVMVLGGLSRSGSAMASTEIYEPATGSWSAGPALNVERYGHTATVLPGGLLLVVGGFGRFNIPMDSIEIYDPAVNGWQITGQLGAARALHTATLLMDGRVLLAGGHGESGPSDSAEIFTPDKTDSIWQNLMIDMNKHYTAVFTLETGTFRVELFAADAPITVDNFVKLAREGYYDGVTFHRVIPGFMAQGGDPTGTGSGGPGYTISDEFSSRTHDRPGVLSMANAGPNTGGSQFFITYAAASRLDGKHTVFGQVVEGMEVVEKITPRDPATATGPGDVIVSVEIIEE